MFLLCIAMYGVLQSSKNKDLEDFFLGGKNVSWITSMFSIVATETSVLTFISIPGIAYRGDWTFLQLALGYILGRFFVSIFLIPIYFNYGITSIYEILLERFGKNIQRLGSLTFLVTRVLADGVRFAAIAIIIQAVTNWSIPMSILIVGIITLIYSVFGGLKTIIQIDALQFFIYLASAIICIIFLFQYIELTPFQTLEYLNSQNKIKMFDFAGNIFNKPFMLFSAIIGGAMLSFASHGADYMMVQRVLATKDISSARKAMIGSGFFVFFQFLLFLFIGSLIYVATDCVLLDKDSEVSYVITNFLPIGFKGIVIAGVLSVAMSTLSSSINSLTSSTINDWFPKNTSLKTSRLIAILWTVVLTTTALLFSDPTDALVIIGLKIASFTYGVLLTFFILSKINMKFENINIIVGYIFGILAVFYFIKFEIAWTFYILGSVFVNLIIVMILENFKKYMYVRDIVYTILLFSIFSLLTSFKFYDEDKNTNIIDIKVKESCIGGKVLTGYDIFHKYPQKFKNLNNVALVVNHTSNIINIDSVSNLINIKLENIKVSAIFTPEHGLANDFQAGEKIKDNIINNIPVISLYGKNRKPTSNELDNIDAVIFDIQDVGSRYYTYVSTMTLVMEACAEKNIPFYILDRPNPIGGKIEGPILNVDFSSFVGMHPIPIRHGMTIGELAYMINNLGWLNQEIKTDLHIVKMQGWNREMFYDETGLNFVSPSPNITNLNTALMYNGICLLEGTNISEGRGTDSPFMKIGAPWLKSKNLLIKLNHRKFEGIEFKLTEFIPKSIPGKAINPKYLSEKCYGVSFIIKDKNKVKPLEIALFILEYIALNHKGDFLFNENNFIDKLYGSDILRNSINSDKKIDKIIQNWQPFVNKQYLLY